MSRLDEWNYYNDPRVRSASRVKRYDIADGRLQLRGSRVKDFIESILQEAEGEWDDLVAATERSLGNKLYEEDGVDIISVPVNMSWAVCPLCYGEGKVVNPSIDCGGLTQEDFDEDPAFREDYFSGVYDVTCPECHGRTTVPLWESVKTDEWSVRVCEWISKMEEYDLDDCGRGGYDRGEFLMGA